MRNMLTLAGATIASAALTGSAFAQTANPAANPAFAEAATRMTEAKTFLGDNILIVVGMVAVLTAAGWAATLLRKK